MCVPGLASLAGGTVCKLIGIKFQRLSVLFQEFFQIRIPLRDTYVASFLKKYLRGGTVRTCCSTKISLLLMFLLGNSLACKA